MPAWVKRIFFFPFFAENKVLHNLFEITILIKGFNGFWEIALGGFFAFSATDNIRGIMAAAAGYGIAGGYLQNQAGIFSVDTQYFLAAYFLFYGAVNLFLAVSLLRGKLWAYPAAIVFFLAFIGYLWYRFYLYQSWLLLFFIIFDIIFVALVCLEYRRVQIVKRENMQWKN